MSIQISRFIKKIHNLQELGIKVFYLVKYYGIKVNVYCIHVVRFWEVQLHNLVYM